MVEVLAQRGEPPVDFGAQLADLPRTGGEAFRTPAVRRRPQQRDQGGRRREDHVGGECVFLQRRVFAERGVEERVGRDEQHDELRRIGDRLPVPPVAELLHVVAQLARMCPHPLGATCLVGRLHRLEPRGERHFRVDDDGLAVDKPDNHVRALGAHVARGVDLFVEVHVLERASGLDDTAQLHLAPSPTNLWAAQGTDELSRFLPQRILGGAHLLNLFEQAAVRPLTAALDVTELRVDPNECVLTGPEQLGDRALASGQRRVGTLVLSGEPLTGEREERLVVLGERRAGGRGERIAETLRVTDGGMPRTCRTTGPPGREARTDAQQDEQDRGHVADGDGHLRQKRRWRRPPRVLGRGPRWVASPHVSLAIGIVGLPNVGKSTLFNALTRASVLAANYPFATIEPNVGIVPVPDARLAELAKLYDSARIVPASVEFVDIAGIVRGASEGQGLGNQFLAHIRECDAICQVVRAFDDPDVVHVDGRVDPIADIETVNTELILADLQTLDNRLPRLEKEAKGDKARGPFLEAARAAREVLDGGTPVSAAAGLDRGLLRELFLLTAKPFIYVVNVDESQLGDSAVAQPVRAAVAPAEVVTLCAKVESELVELEPAEAAEMLSSYGQDSSGLEQLAHVGFRTLGLQTYLTAGPKEARAWTIPVGATAPQAAGVIHTDFEKGFIKAEVVGFDDLVAAGSVPAARSVGKARIEGKEYVMRDGDVVEFRFNV